MGLHPVQSPEEIQRIEADDDDGNVAPTPTPEVEATPQPQSESQEPENKKRMRGTYSQVWEHFTKGEVNEDGTYLASCKYCKKAYKMGNQRSTTSMKHHIMKGCKYIPSAKRHKPDALQRMLQAGRTETGNILLSDIFSIIPSCFTCSL